jgi:hypothetical protein
MSLCPRVQKGWQISKACTESSDGVSYQSKYAHHWSIAASGHSKENKRGSVVCKQQDEGFLEHDT